MDGAVIYDQLIRFASTADWLVPAEVQRKIARSLRVAISTMAEDDFGRKTLLAAAEELERESQE